MLRFHFNRKVSLFPVFIGLSMLTQCKSTPNASYNKEVGTEAEDSSANRNSERLLLDVNDVSLLFPAERLARKSQDGSVKSKVEPSPNLETESLISQTLLDDVLSASESADTIRDATIGVQNDEDFRNLKNWRIVGMRFDPCAPSGEVAFHKTPEVMQKLIPGCLVQIRLIAQPLASGAADTGFFFSDTTLHLVYTLGIAKKGEDAEGFRKNFASYLPYIKGLQKIKSISLESGTNTDGLPLGVHPGLKKEYASPNRPVADAVADLIKRSIGRKNLTNIAFMGRNSVKRGLQWIFLGGSVINDEKGQHFVAQPNLAYHNKKVMAVARRFPAIVVRNEKAEVSAENPFNDITPLPEDPSRSLSPFFEDSRQILPVSQSATIIVHEVEHPARTHIFNTDCVSCHASRIMKSTIAKDASNRYIIPTGISGYIANFTSDADYDLRNFGYVDGTPVINVRTLTETAAVADLTNLIIAGQKHSNPGLDCGQDAQRLEEIWNCQFDSAKNGNCFQSCKILGQ